MTDTELQEVVAAVIEALKTNGKTIDQLTAVTDLANSDNLEVSGGKKISFGKLKEIVATDVTVSAEEIKGYVVIDSTSELPEEPTPEQQQKGYLLDTTLYVYVGTGGDTLDGKYQSANMKGADGSPGVGFNSVASPSTADGTVTITLTNGDTITIDLNHTHPSYSRKKTVTNTSDATVTLDADVIYDLGTVVGNKTINLPSTVDVGADYEFRFAYTSGTISGTAISGTAVANDATLSFTAGKTYQVIISGGILYFSETTTPS